MAEFRYTDASPQMDPAADRERVLALAHRTASKYRHNEAPDKLPVYEFLPHHLMDFVDKVRALSEPAPSRPHTVYRLCAAHAHLPVTLNTIAIAAAPVCPHCAKK